MKPTPQSFLIRNQRRANIAAIKADSALPPRGVIKPDEFRRLVDGTLSAADRAIEIQSTKSTAGGRSIGAFCPTEIEWIFDLRRASRGAGLTFVLFDQPMIQSRHVEAQSRDRESDFAIGDSTRRKSTSRDRPISIGINLRV